MDTTQLNNIDPNKLQSLLGGSTPTNIIPDSLVNTLTVGFIALNVISVLFLIAYIFGIVRKWKVQSAVLHMQKDLAEIKASMVVTPAQAPAPAPVVEQPTEPVTEKRTEEYEQPQS